MGSAQEGDQFLDLFLDLKKHLAGKIFDDDDEVHEEIMTWFKEQAADFYDSGIQKLVPRLNIEQCRRLWCKIKLCTGNSFTTSLL
jgi:hypothetical protein